VKKCVPIRNAALLQRRCFFFNPTIPEEQLYRTLPCANKVTKKLVADRLKKRYAIFEISVTLLFFFKGKYNLLGKTRFSFFSDKRAFNLTKPLKRYMKVLGTFFFFF
jgi:hypothetical protein